MEDFADTHIHVQSKSQDETPVRSVPWPTYDKGNVATDGDDARAACRAVNSRRLFRYDTRNLCDTETGQFEKEITDYFGVKYALATTGGTSAIALSLLALGVGPGDEVLLSAFGFPATPSAIVLTGAKPVLVSVDDNLHLDLEDLKSKVTPKTKAVLMVHMRGQTGDVKSVAEYCDKVGLPLVEDAVPVLGLKIGDQYAGTFGKLGAFSTQSDKSLNTGEGGFLITDDRHLYERAVVMCGAYEGRINKHCNGQPPMVNEFALPLFNFRMDEVRAAIARVQLRRLPARTKRMRENYQVAEEIIASYPQLKVRQSFDEGATLGDTILFSMPGGSAQQLSDLSSALNREGIECRSFSNVDRINVRAFWTWEFLFPDLTTDEIRNLLPHAAERIDVTLDIPLSPLLVEQDLRDLQCI